MLPVICKFLKIGISAVLLGLSLNHSFADEPCIVVTSFDWTPSEYLRGHSGFKNPTIECSRQMADEKNGIFVVDPVFLSSKQPQPLEMKKILDSIRQKYPSCSILGLGFFLPKYRGSPFTDTYNGGRPLSLGRSDAVTGLEEFVPSFPQGCHVREEVTARNTIDHIGGSELDPSLPVEPGGVIINRSAKWLAALDACSAGKETCKGVDHDQFNGDACNQETYLLNEMGSGGFFHISDCSTATVSTLKKVVSCMKSNFQPQTDVKNVSNVLSGLNYPVLPAVGSPSSDSKGKSGTSSADPTSPSQSHGAGNSPSGVGQ
jgi:hypothetical protein